MWILETVYYHFRKWCVDGTWQTLNTALRRQERTEHDRTPEPSGAIIDSQRVKTTEAGGERGFDAGKGIKGRKRHTLVDTCGNLLEVVVKPADGQDREDGKLVFDKLPKETLAALQKIWADGSYRGPDFAAWLQEKVGALLEIAFRPPMLQASSLSRFAGLSNALWLGLVVSVASAKTTNAVPKVAKASFTSLPSRLCSSAFAQLPTSPYADKGREMM